MQCSLSHLFGVFGAGASGIVSWLRQAKAAKVTESLTNVHTFLIKSGLFDLILIRLPGNHSRWTSRAAFEELLAKKKRRERPIDQWLCHYTPIHLTKEMHVNRKNKGQNIKIITTATFLIEPLLGKAVCVEECWGKFSTLTSNLEQRLPCTAFANFMHSRAHWTWAVPSPLNSLLRTVIECKGCQECTKKRRLTSYLTCKDRRVRNPQQKDIKQP